MENQADELTTQLIALLHQLLSELGAERAASAITPGASLSRDLGLGSLERAELLRRIEKHFSVHLSHQAINRAKTVNDLIVSIRNVNPDVVLGNHEFVASLAESQTDPADANNYVDVLRCYIPISRSI